MSELAATSTDHLSGNRPRSWLEKDNCSIDEFERLLEHSVSAVDMPLADKVEHHIPLYRAERIVEAVSSDEQVKAYMAEWNRVFASGAGVICIKAAFTDHSLLDNVRDVLYAIIESEKTNCRHAGDHFAPAGENDRLWNAHEKLCVESPELFIQYNANPITPLVSQSWLGPHYQLTTQVNVVHPGGKAQVCHRDYHMGFQSAEVLERYPAHVHALSAALTLQGAIAHSDMPVESGPTQLLPGSQNYIPGYLAAHRPDFRYYFNSHHVQLPLEKGDMLFFNPAVFHAAGENLTDDCRRFANLMQIGSGFGRSIETVDRTRMCNALYPMLLRLCNSAELEGQALADVLAACAEGYPFPTNLDIDSPLDGMVPQSQFELMQLALRERWTEQALHDAMIIQMQNKRSH